MNKRRPGNERSSKNEWKTRIDDCGDAVGFALGVTAAAVLLPVFYVADAVVKVWEAGRRALC